MPPVSFIFADGSPAGHVYLVECSLADDLCGIAVASHDDYYFVMLRPPRPPAPSAIRCHVTSVHTLCLPPLLFVTFAMPHIAVLV